MTVRLAFAVMIQADTDILLIDEVLAVGDASFQQKCADVFHGHARAAARRSSSSPTTWERSRRYCDRAMLIHDGDVVTSAIPRTSRRGYFRINFEAAAADPEPSRCPRTRWPRRCGDQRAHRGRRGPDRGRRRRARRTASSRGSRSASDAVVEALEELRNPVFSFLCSSRTGPTCSASGALSSAAVDGRAIVAAGERVELAGTDRTTL